MNKLNHQIEALTKLGTLTIKYDDENHLFGVGLDAGTWVSGTDLGEVIGCLVSKTPLLGQSGNLRNGELDSEAAHLPRVAGSTINDEAMAAAAAMQALSDYGSIVYSPETNKTIESLIIALGKSVLKSAELKNSSTK